MQVPSMFQGASLTRLTQVTGTVAMIFIASQFDVIVRNARYYGAVKRDTVSADGIRSPT